MNLPKIQALVAPLSAPVPSALGIGLQAYRYFEATSSILGWIAAVGGFLGIEAIGGASCYSAVKLHRERNYGIEFWVSMVGIIVYISSGAYVLHDPAILIFFFLTPFAYFSYAILRSMEAEITEKVSETNAQIALIDAQRKLTNAQTRKEKASVRPNSTERTENRSERTDTISVREQVFAYLKEHPEAGPREIERSVGCSVSTASKYVKEYNNG